MAEALIGALDQGTTSTRFLIIDAAGVEVARAQAEHNQILPRPGWVEHEPDEIWARTCEVIGQALHRAGIDGSDLAAIGITNQRETTVAWDADSGAALANAIVWQDTRHQDAIDELSADEQVADAIRERTGVPPATYFAAGKAQWLLRHNDAVARAAERGTVRFGTVDTWLLHRLTGAFVTDVTNASRWMLLDQTGAEPAALDFADDLLDLFGLRREWLPQVVASIDADAFGTTAADGPLRAEVPVTTVLGDQQAATVGQACFEPGEGKNTYGTGNFLMLNTGERVRSDAGLLTTPAYQFAGQEPVWALEGSVAVTGSAVQWLRDQLGIISTAPEIEELAGSVDDTGGVYFVPAFSGLFAPYWRPDARGTVVGLTRYATKAHLARATLEAICFQSCDVVDAMVADSGIELTELRVDGGVTENDLCMQIQADTLDVDVVRPVLAETTALGAAYGAGLAVGVYDSTDALRDLWRVDRRWRPQIGAAQRDQAYARWQQAVKRSLDWA